MLSETRPSKVGKWTEPALRVLRERYLNRKGDEVVETPEELWREFPLGTDTPNRRGWWV